MPFIRPRLLDRLIITAIISILVAVVTNNFAQESSPPAETKAAKPLRILILGGTGFTGPFQVHYALARGHKVTVFNRGKTHPGELPEGVEQLIGDRNGQLDALKDRKWDVVIDNPTSVPVWVRDVAQDSARATSIVTSSFPRFLFTPTTANRNDETSALAKYEGADAMKETRDSLIASKFALYGPLKALSEQEAEKWFPKKTLIIRPGLIVGPGDQTDRFTYWPVRIDRGGEVLAPGDPKDPVQFIDARDLAEWTIRMVEKGETGIYNATGPANELGIGEMLERNQNRAEIRGEVHLGGRRISRGAESRALVGHAGLGSAARARKAD